MKTIVFAVLLTILMISSAAEACRSCANWSTWGQRAEVCSVPSEMELTNAIDCWRTTCGVECGTWIDGYDECAASGDPTCEPGPAPSGPPDNCDLCIEGVGPYQGIGCQAETQACSYDKTDCVPCSEWIDGGDVSNMCWDSIGLANDLVDAACAGTCAAKCAAACPGGWFEPALAGFKCGACLGATPSFAACSLQTN